MNALLPRPRNSSRARTSTPSFTHNRAAAARTCHSCSVAGMVAVVNDPAYDADVRSTSPYLSHCVAGSP